jgi:geranylgeranyl pyrophosphate synthase
VEHSWRLAGGTPEQVPELLPWSIELLHAGSLVIDDIQDDSLLRRGEPSLHRRYGLPLALNTGNYLYFMAMVILARLKLPAESLVALYEDVNLALLRCHQGQALDLSVAITDVRRQDAQILIDGATRLKTGSLMSLGSLLGARAAGGAPDVVDALGRFGSELGVGLQMLDDWSGIAVEKRRAKGLEDIKLARPTWPWAWLAEAGDELAYAEVARHAKIASIDWQVEQVRDRMRALLSERAPLSIRAQLDGALEGLRAALGDSDELTALREDVDGIEQAFGRT